MKLALLSAMPVLAASSGAPPEHLSASSTSTSLRGAIQHGLALQASLCGICTSHDWACNTDADCGNDPNDPLAYDKCNLDGCSPGPSPSPPSGPTAPATVAGQFTMPNAANCEGSGKWDACPGWAKSEETICFGGASQTSWQDQINCLPYGKHGSTGATYNIARATADKVWYSFGGGDPKDNQYWSKAALTSLNAFISDDTLDSDSFTGIFYDVEVIFDAEYSDFADSFKLAKSKGLRVMVGTSYTAPYNCQGACAGYPVAFPAGTDALWKQILQNTDIDVLSPQWYAGSGNGEVSFSQTSASSVTFADWNTLVPSSTKIVSMLKVWSDFDANLKTAMARLQAGCDGNADQARFCETGSVYVWTAG